MLLLITALWSFAEAGLWFIAADLPISFVAVRYGYRQGCIAALVAALAAPFGGVLIYTWSATDAQSAQQVITSIPGISEKAMQVDPNRFAQHPLEVTLQGSFSGVPYKVFAFAAGKLHLPPAEFLIMTPLARLPRFLAIALWFATLSRLLASVVSMRTRLWLWAGNWLVAYTAYFALHR